MPNTPRTLIVGTGVSGIGAAVIFKHKLGLESFRLFEKDPSGVGGVWRKQRYLGLSCDIPAPFYSYSFEKSPNWTRNYPAASELQPYLAHVVEKYGIGPHIQYSSEIKEIHWDDDKGLWNVHMHVQGKPEIKQFELIFNSCGVFTDPYTPEIEGISTFKGKQVHASAWDIEAASLVGKNVCLVGTGPTAIQIVPEIAHMVKKLTIFSRTPNWIIPMDNEPFSPAQLNEFRTNPDKLRAYRQALMDQTEKMWLLVSVPGSSTAKKIQQRCLDSLKATVKDPELVKLLTPDYPIGCKRIQFDPGFLRCLNRSNVKLTVSPISHATPEGLVTKDGAEHPADVIIYATGWGAFSMGRGYPIYGRGGVEVWDYWKQVGVPRSYMGLMLHGFPNLFWAIGPNSQVWSSFFEVIETKIDLAAKLVKHMMLTNAKSFEPRLDLEEQWSQMCMERLKTTPYAAGCISYYKWQKSSPHINGKEEMKKDEETYYPAWFPGVPSELRELSDNATPNEFVWAPKTDGKWDVPTPPVNSPWKEDRMKATPIKLRGEGARL